jgi:hypothetical protein
MLRQERRGQMISEAIQFAAWRSFRVAPSSQVVDELVRREEGFRDRAQGIGEITARRRRILTHEPGEVSNRLRSAGADAIGVRLRA